jgi:hypothetical protein
MRTIAAALTLVASVSFGAPLAWSSPPRSIRIQTVRERGAPGSFDASGAVSDTGSFTTLAVHVSAAGAPDFLVVHASYRFVGAKGEFTLHVEIKETLTSDPNVLTGVGRWVMQDGTGAYEKGHGSGEIEGVVDENAEPDLFLRTYTGSFHVD